MPLTPGGIFYPDSNTDMSLSGILAQMANSIDTLLEDTGWIQFTPAVGTGWSPCYYRRYKGLLILNGSGTLPSKAAVHTIFTLPVGFRPSQQTIWRVSSSQAANPSPTIILQPSGVLQAYVPNEASAASVSFSTPVIPVT